MSDSTVCPPTQTWTWLGDKPFYLADGNEYTVEELILIQRSRTNNEDGSERRATITGMDGTHYTVAGEYRFEGDFTIRASYPIHAVNQHTRWIREPNPDDEPDVVQGWFVPVPLDQVMRLQHINGLPIRSRDTFGMFAGGMSLTKVKRRTPSEIASDAAERAERNPGLLETLSDDIKPGESPRDHIARRASEEPH